MSARAKFGAPMIARPISAATNVRAAVVVVFMTSVPRMSDGPLKRHATTRHPQWPRVNVSAPRRRSDNDSRWVIRRVSTKPVDQQVVGESERAARGIAIRQRIGALGARQTDRQHAESDKGT